MAQKWKREMDLHVEDSVRQKLSVLVLTDVGDFENLTYEQVINAGKHDDPRA